MQIASATKGEAFSLNQLEERGKREGDRVIVWLVSVAYITL